MSNQAKQLRGQLRQIVQEQMPSLLNSALVKDIEAAIEARVNQRLDGITQTVKSTLDRIDERSKDIQSYVLRSSEKAVMPTPSGEAPAAETTSEKAE